MSTLQGNFQSLTRRVTRLLLLLLIRVSFCLLMRLKIVGKQNIPHNGPLLIVANHFHFADPLAIILAIPAPFEFIGGARMPFAPRLVRALPKLWGYHAVYRGTGARDALRSAENELLNGGKIAIFPEGGGGATVLRPARPGTAFLAARTGAHILPVGIEGLVDMFHELLHGRRPRVTVRIGKPFGPFEASGRGRERRKQLDEISDEIMQHVASLIPPERRGYYSRDPQVRAAAKGTEIYPWARSKDEQEI
jgi:1-acyl-sn-glycerol-3-phosphate acyltransferase